VRVEESMNFNWEETPDLNITPLVDIMLVLLAILMVTTPIIEYEDNITLPQGSRNQSIDKMSDLVIRVDKNRVIYIDKEEYEFDSFADSFALLSEKYPKDTVVYIKADRNLKYNDVMMVLKTLKDSSYTKVSLVTDG